MAQPPPRTAPNHRDQVSPERRSRSSEDAFAPNGSLQRCRPCERRLARAGGAGGRERVGDGPQTASLTCPPERVGPGCCTPTPAGVGLCTAAQVGLEQVPDNAGGSSNHPLPRIKTHSLPAPHEQVSPHETRRPGRGGKRSCKASGSVLSSKAAGLRGGQALAPQLSVRRRCRG